MIALRAIIYSLIQKSRNAEESKFSSKHRIYIIASRAVAMNWKRQKQNHYYLRYDLKL